MGELLGFPRELPCIREVYMVCKFWFSICLLLGGSQLRS